LSAWASANSSAMLAFCSFCFLRASMREVWVSCV
jgi:hypothetical protein